jgi:hypothetical protein
MLKSASRSTLGGSSHLERIHRLSEKIGDLKIVTEHEKYGRLDNVERTIKLLEDAVFEQQEQFTKKLTVLKEGANGIQKRFNDDKEEYDKHYNDDIQDMMLLEKKLQSLTDKEKTRRRDYENRLLNNIEEKSGFLKTEIQKENAIMSESFSQLNQIYESDIQKLQGGLAQEIDEREEGDNKMWEFSSNELRKIQDHVSEYKGSKDDGEKKIYATIKEAVTKIKELLDEEREVREITHEKMINLLEESCKNLTKQEYE